MEAEKEIPNLPRNDIVDLPHMDDSVSMVSSVRPMEMRLPGWEDAATDGMSDSIAWRGSREEGWWESGKWKEECV